MRAATVTMLPLLWMVVALAGGERTGIIEQALNLGLNGSDDALRDCIWRRSLDRDSCPDPDVHMYLYTSLSPSRRVVVPTAATGGDWERRSGFDPHQETVLLVHGYAGGDGLVPGVIIRDAYLSRGNSNVLVLDWGTLSRVPCYPAAVHNLRAVARCAARQLEALREDTGVALPTCVGHSLGAHLCGLIARYLRFRITRIIGLDPARPLIRPQVRLGNGDADHVQVLHTNAGHYGDSAARMSHVSFCVNGGRLQPFCRNRPNPDLCSHLRSVCYLAESLSRSLARKASPCSRRCGVGVGASRRLIEKQSALLMGAFTPLGVSGFFCVHNEDEPFCPKSAGGPGDLRCCGDPEKVPKPLSLTSHEEKVVAGVNGSMAQEVVHPSGDGTTLRIRLGYTTVLRQGVTSTASYGPTCPHRGTTTTQAYQHDITTLDETNIVSPERGGATPVHVTQGYAKQTSNSRRED